MTIAAILTSKGSEVATIGAEDSVSSAVASLGERRIGALPVVRDGMILMVDDDRFPLAAGEEVVERTVRFRTLGCYPLTGAVESEAASLADIIAEMRASTSSEREGRAIDHDSSGSMERKKKEGYF